MLLMQWIDSLIDVLNYADLIIKKDIVYNNRNQNKTREKDQVM
jgi:hypothetical protein